MNKVTEQIQIIVDTSESDSKGEVGKLVEIIRNIKDDYVKYLRIFSYFDNNSLGTISEVLLTKLLIRSGIEARHTGASGGLADLYIGDKPISLKTTASNKYIGLGSDQINTNSQDSKVVTSALENTELHEINSVAELKDLVKAADYELITARIKAIAIKLAGTENKEYFVWIEKKKIKDILSEIIIHVHKFDLVDVENELMSYKPYYSKKGWGLKDSKGSVIVQADTTGKLLNVSPTFVRKSSEGNTLRIILEESTNRHSNTTLTDNVTNALLNSLDTLYNDIFV